MRLTTDDDGKDNLMTKILYGACGNEGCLDCTPAFVIELDGGEEQYEEVFDESNGE